MALVPSFTALFDETFITKFLLKTVIQQLCRVSILLIVFKQKLCCYKVFVILFLKSIVELRVSVIIYSTTLYRSFASSLHSTESVTFPRWVRWAVDSGRVWSRTWESVFLSPSHCCIFSINVFKVRSLRQALFDI